MNEYAGALAETYACGGGDATSTFGADSTEGGAAVTERVIHAGTLLPGEPAADRPNEMNLCSAERRGGGPYPPVEGAFAISGPRGAASNIALVTALIGTPEGSRHRHGGGRATATSLGGGAAGADAAPAAFMKTGPGTLSGADTA